MLRGKMLLGRSPALAWINRSGHEVDPRFQQDFTAVTLPINRLNFKSRGSSVAITKNRYEDVYVADGTGKYYTNKL